MYPVRSWVSLKWAAEGRPARPERSDRQRWLCPSSDDFRKPVGSVLRQLNPSRGAVVELDRATVCLPIKDRSVSHAFYTALGFVAVGEPGDDGLPEPLQFQISVGLRVMLIPAVGFGWVIGRRRRSLRSAHECLVVIGLATDAEVDELMRRAQMLAATSSSRPRTRRGAPSRRTMTSRRRRVQMPTPARSPIPTATCGRSPARTAS
jgi:predicted lactoylglutathione lyase